jgi:hypothetical protein
MSTGFECQLVKTPDGWYCVLQDYSCPVGAFDWTDYAVAYGPCADAEEAYMEMSEHNANPGGYSRISDPPQGYIDKIKSMPKGR